MQWLFATGESQMRQTTKIERSICKLFLSLSLFLTHSFFHYDERQMVIFHLKFHLIKIRRVAIIRCFVMKENAFQLCYLAARNEKLRPLIKIENILSAGVSVGKFLATITRIIRDTFVWYLRQWVWKCCRCCC